MTARSTRLFLILIALILLALPFSQTVLASSHEQAQLSIPILVANTSFLNIRSGDGPQYTVIVTVVGGTELPALGVNHAGTWYLVSTPVGNGWVDVSYTIPRGDFRFVPVIEAQAQTQTLGSTPLTIGLVSASAPANNTPAATTTTTSVQMAKLNVLSVNLRSQPAEEYSAVITTLYLDEHAEFQVVGRAFDKRFVEWAALVVPNFGTGWVEAAKLTYRTVQTTVTTTPAQPGAATSSSGIPIPHLEAPIIIVNTSYQNIRSGPGGQYTVITSVPGGTVFHPAGITSDLSWYLVSGDFGFGWISSEYVVFRGEFRNVPVLHNLY